MSEALNVITAAFGGMREVTTARLWQWDYGQILKITGLNLPTAFEVHFSNSKERGTSKTQIGQNSQVTIPDEYLTSGAYVYAFIYLHEGETDGETEYRINIPVKERPQPTDVEPTPQEQSEITQAIAALNSAVEQTGADATAADASARAAAQSAEDAESAAQAIEDMTVSSQTLAAGSSATVTKTESGGVVNLEFGIPKGETGITPDLTIGTVQTLPAGSQATAEITGTDEEPVLSLGIPQGADGDDGVSPTVTITPITGGHRITITDADGEHSADVMDGTGNVEDVQINGTSIVNNNIAEIPVASVSTLGIVKTSDSIGISNGAIEIIPASAALIRYGLDNNRGITPGRQHYSTFYGLAKAAGDTTQPQSSNAVGSYTENAKSAIHDMLNAPVEVSGTTPTIAAKSGIQYICGEVSTLDITLPDSGIVDVVFTSGSTATVLTVTPPTGQTVRWANGFDATALEANTVYEINILNGLGVVQTWSVT